MSSPAFTLQVPADSNVRTVLSEAAGRYVELMGGTPEEAAALARTLSGKVDELARDSHEVIHLECRPGPQGVDVMLRTGSASAVVHHALTAARS